MLKFYLSPNGRVSRKAYWYGYILPVLAVIAFSAYFIIFTIGAPFETLGNNSGTDSDLLEVMSAVTSREQMIVSAPLALLLTWVPIAVGFKRLHDRGRTGWWMFIPVAPLAISDIIADSDLFIAAEAGGAVIAVVLWAGLLFLWLALNLWLWITMWFLPGVSGDNKFGPNPLSIGPLSEPSSPSSHSSLLPSSSDVSSVSTPHTMVD